MTHEHACPNGCGTYQRLSRHWSGPNCAFPTLEARQREVVEGLLLAGATIAGNGPNKHLVVGTTNATLAEWLADELDWLTHSIRERDGDGNRHLEYRVRTHAHVTLSRYESWTEVNRAPPADYTLTPPVARVWYALAGGLQWHGEYDSQRGLTFSALEADRSAWITRLLAGVGLEPTQVDRRVQLPPTKADRFLKWIGDPVPGVEYKWAPTRRSYDAMKQAVDPNSRTHYTPSECFEALREAADILGESPSYPQYGQLGLKPSRDTIVRLCGRWNVAKTLAEVSTEPTRRDGPVFDDDELLEALCEVADELGHPPNTTEYETRRQSPSVLTIQQRFGTWEDALREAGALDATND